MFAWQQWVHHPEGLWVRKCFFYVPRWVGAMVGLYIVLMSITGSFIVCERFAARRAANARCPQESTDLLGLNLAMDDAYAAGLVTR